MASEPLRCSCRRHAVTNLRCARCETPICPDCAVVAPAGMLCRECGSPKHSPLFQVSAGNLALAFLVCLGVSVLGGWLLVGVGLGFGFFALWGALLFGGAVGEVALRVTGRKRGLQMELLAGGTTAAGMLAGWLIKALSFQPPPGVPVAFPLFPGSPLFYLMAGVAVFAAVSRIRYL